MAQVLELTQLGQDHGVTQMDIRRSRVSTQFYTQRTPFF